MFRRLRSRGFIRWSDYAFKNNASAYRFGSELRYRFSPSTTNQISRQYRLSQEALCQKVLEKSKVALNQSKQIHCY